MSSIDKLEGFWKVVAYEQNGIERSSEECKQRAWLILGTDDVVPGSHGIWGEIKYLKEFTPEIAGRSLCSLRQLIAGENDKQSEDFYIYSGGIIYPGMTDDGTDTIDLMAYHGPHMHPIISDSVCRCIFRFDGKQLTLCLADAHTKTRPSHFGSTETPNQSLTVYVRDERGGMNGGWPSHMPSAPIDRKAIEAARAAIRRGDKGLTKDQMVWRDKRS